MLCLCPEVRAFLLKHAAPVHTNIERLRQQAMALSQSGESLEPIRPNTELLIDWLAKGARKPRDIALQELCAAFPADLRIAADGHRHTALVCCACVDPCVAHHTCCCTLSRPRHWPCFAQGATSTSSILCDIM